MSAVEVRSFWNRWGWVAEVDTVLCFRTGFYAESAEAGMEP